MGALCLAAEATAQQLAEGTVHELKGKVLAAQEAEISARIDGRLANIHFRPGQIVKKGDLLFAFDAKFREISLAAAHAKQKVVEAQLQLADVKLRNTKSLRARDASSEMQLLEAQAEREILAANAAEAKANVQAAQLQLDQTKLFSPIEGMIGPPSVREGAYLTLAAVDRNSLALIIQLDPIHVAAGVPFDIFLQRREMFDSRKAVSDKMEYTLVLPSGEKYAHKGRLVAGTGEFDPTSQAMTIVEEFENPEYLLRPGLQVTLKSSVR
jgi:membrane fusion protein (multidrug efflux system)